jgi:3-isopropylmalate/(R)-2-methylmalate dehydratase large subunit
MTSSLTLFDKLWMRHEILQHDGESLLWVDRHYVHEGSFHAFDRLAERGATVAEPKLTFGVADHYVPTRGRDQPIANPEIARMVSQLQKNTAAQDITLFGLKDPRQGIVHVVGPELGLTLPGLLIVCGDSHTSTHGAFGAFAFGIGASEVAHVLMTQTLWQKKPRRMRITADGKLAEGLGAKDLALAIIAKIGADGATGHAIEFAGSAISALSMEARMTLCNMAIEAGGRCGIIAPDATTFEYLRGREFAPKDDALKKAMEDWIELKSDSGAQFDREISIDATTVAPFVTWGTSPEDALPIDGHVPDPDCAESPERAKYIQGALDYMGVKRQAEAEGLDKVFRAAGLEWADSGCSMCVGINGDLVANGERCASTTNRNFRGRQGVGARTHIMSPAMVAAAAVYGHLTDVRPFLAYKD